MDEYKYPDSLYCVKCDLDVEPKIVTKSEYLVREFDPKSLFEYPVAVCPFCNEELCRRGYYHAFAKAVKEHMESEK